MNEQPVLSHSADAALNVQIREYLDLVRRRKSWILLICLGISVCIAVVAMRLPNVYRAEATILVNPPKVNENFVTTMGENSGARLSTVRREVMSPTRLGQLVDELKMYSELRGKVSAQGLVARMQSATAIEFQDSGRQRVSSIHIAFTDADPDQAARAANRIAALFIERNLQARVQEIYGASQFLESELGETKQQLEAKEHTLQDLKSRNIMDLPESKQYYLKAVNALRNQLRISQERVDGDRRTKVDLQQSMAGKVARATGLDAQPADPNSPSQARLKKLEAQMKDMLVHYGPDYVDVRKLRNEINQLKVKVESEKPVGDASEPQAGKPAPQKRNPVVEAEVNQLDQDIEDQTKAQAKLQNQIQYHVGKLQQVAVFEEQIAELTRDCDALRNRYSQLQEKKGSARVAGELEIKSAGERLEILDAAVPGGSPYGPKRTILIIGGVLIGLLCGIGGAVLVEISDESVRHEREVAQIFGKAVLAGIPKITSSRERAWARCRMAGLTGGTAAVASAFGFLISKLVV